MTPYKLDIFIWIVTIDAFIILQIALGVILYRAFLGAC